MFTTRLLLLHKERVHVYIYMASKQKGQKQYVMLRDTE